MGFELLPRWVRAFRQRWPQVGLELIEATGDVQLELLARGEVDAGMVLHSPGWQAPGLAQARVGSEPLVVALPEAHPLAGLARPGLGALLNEPLVIFPRRILPTLHDAILAIYNAAGRAPQVAQEAIQMQTIVNRVSAGWPGLGCRRACGSFSARRGVPQRAGRRAGRRCRCAKPAWCGEGTP